MNRIYLSASARLSLWETLKNPHCEQFIRSLSELLHKHSHASIEFPGGEPYETEDEKLCSLTAVLDKIVSRGNPTLADLNFEERLLKSSNLQEIQTQDLSAKTGNRLVGRQIELPQKINLKKLLTDAREQMYMHYSKEYVQHQSKLKLDENLKSICSEEEQIFYDKFEKFFSIGLQAYLQRQQLISHLVGYEDQSIKDNRVDFSLQIENIKWVFEIDGEQHEQEKQHDRQRDSILESNGWQVFRIPAKKVRENLTSWFNSFKFSLSSEDKETLSRMDATTLNKELKSTAFTAILLPHIVHRCLRALIQMLRYQSFPVKEKVKILVIEEDVVAIPEAIYQLIQLWKNISTLSPTLPPLSNITLHLVGSEPLVAIPKIDNLNIEFRQEPDIDYDLIISHSFTLFSGQKGVKQLEFLKNMTAKTVEVRTAPINYEFRKLQWSLPLTYELKDLEEALISKSADNLLPISKDKYSALRYFLQTIFRKYDFWEGQARVISRLLQGKTSIVLLPTGGGKSLTYQLASLLLPGVTIVIDPLVALMEDQEDNLRTMGFDRTGSISGLLDTNQKNIALNNMAKGVMYYVFIAPERLQTEEFRGQLKTLVAQFPISLAVIDEVHCVSEWGHDFRPSYLHLARNIKKYCTREGNDPPTLVGLTGTASFAVLTDVQMELGIKGRKRLLYFPSHLTVKNLFFMLS